jgi:hypothetical protein
MKKLIIPIIALTVFASSCKKEIIEKCEPIVIKESEQSYKSYYPLAKGSYWIYQHYKVDSLGNEEALNTFDTTSVIGDTIIKGLKFYIVKSSNKPTGNYTQYLRDSLNFTVFNNGKIKTCPSNFLDTLNSGVYLTNGDTLFTVYQKVDKYQNINLPIGSFVGLNIPHYFTSYSLYGLHSGKIKYSDNEIYAENIGKIISTYRYLGGYSMYKQYYERRLVEYNLN